MLAARRLEQAGEAPHRARVPEALRARAHRRQEGGLSAGRLARGEQLRRAHQVRFVEGVAPGRAQVRGQGGVGEDALEDPQPRLVDETDAAVALAAVHPVLAERLVDARPAHAAEREPQEEVPVLVHLQRLVEAAGIRRRARDAASRRRDG